eukprot:TRINITY_DN3244_c0_g1_i1.p1 TRINITY_DN3244_c0_g1~~TRINITY_DN3244_c0_g1_i1.p1  ORF type:complete len:181 (-),score=3.65 TRINITY_DN3244_c0_g1_i1:153-695(-)
MRPLTEQEGKVLFEKLAKYIGANTSYLIDRPDEPWVFRLHNQRVLYMTERIAKKAEAVGREQLMSAGIVFGRFTHSGKFKLEVTCLDFLAQYAQYKVWIKPSQEQSYTYGNHLTRAGLGRITEGCPRYQGVVVFNMADIPIGFGVTAHSTQGCRKVEANTIVLFHEADIGTYLRDEEHLL